MLPFEVLTVAVEDVMTLKVPGVVEASPFSTTDEAEQRVVVRVLVPAGGEGDPRVSERAEGRWEE